MTRIFLLHKHVAYYKYKQILTEKKFKKLESQFFRARKCAYLVLKSPVDW